MSKYIETVQDRLIKAIDDETKALDGCAAFEKRYFAGAKAIEQLGFALDAITKVQKDRSQS